MTALRLLTKDLLILFTCVNEGMINILGAPPRFSSDSRRPELTFLRGENRTLL